MLGAVLVDHLDGLALPVKLVFYHIQAQMSPSSNIAHQQTGQIFAGREGPKSPHKPGRRGKPRSAGVVRGGAVNVGRDSAFAHRTGPAFSVVTVVTQSTRALAVEVSIVRRNVVRRGNRRVVSSGSSP